MTNTIVNNSEHFSLDGPLGLPLAIVVALILLALFTWSLFTEHQVLGKRQTLLFWILRSVALITAVWMLLAPTKVRIETSTTRQAVAFITDVSGSMSTVDPPGSGDDARWAASQAGNDQLNGTKAADRAVVAAGMAQKYLQQATEALNQHKRESLLVESVGAAKAAVASMRTHVETVVDAFGGSIAQEGSSNRIPLASKVLKSINGPEFQDFESLAAALKKGRTPSQKGWRESLPDVEHRLANIRRQLIELARAVEQVEAQEIATTSPKLMASLRKEPRISRAAGLLDSVHESVLTPLLETVDIRQCCFDNSMTRLETQSLPGTEVKKLLPIQSEDDSDSMIVPATTDLSAVLEQLNRDRSEQPIAATFILTDVGHNRAAAVSPRDIATELSETPVYIVPIGNTQHVRDVNIQSVFAPNVAMRNDDIVIEVMLQAFDCSGESCFVQLMEDGEQIDQRTVQIDSGFATRPVRFEQRMNEVGIQSFQVVASPLEGEMTERNNYNDFEVNVTRSDIKVLLADEASRWEHRYLTHLFRRDPKIECDELQFQPRLIATGRRESSGTFPITVDEWDQYDVVMLGDIPPNHLPVAAQESLVEYLKLRGGTVVIMAGQAAMPHQYVDAPLEQIIPVSPVIGGDVGSETGYTFHVTAEGHEHDALMIGESEESTRRAWAFVNAVSPFYEMSKWRRPRAAAHSLIAGIPRGTLDVEYAEKNNSFLCWQAVGRGKVMYLSAAETWRLRLLRGDRLHNKFWGQLLRWATATNLSAGSEAVRIRPGRSRYGSDEVVDTTVWLTDIDGNPIVTEELTIIASQDELERSAPLVPDAEIPGRYHGEFRDLPAGVYRLQAVGDAVDQLLQASDQTPTPAGFIVQGDLPVELMDTRCDRALAQQIADITGGQVLPPTAIAEVLALTNLQPEVAESVETRPLWLEWKYLWIVFGCMQTEWIIRKWKGLS